VVVGREVDPVPADPAMPIDLDASDPAAATGSDPAEHLGVEVDELARAFALVPDDRRPRFEPIQSSEAFTPQDGIDGAAGEPCLPGEDVRPDAEFAALRTQARDEIGRMTPGLVVDRARAVDQATGPSAMPPLRAGLAADAGGSGSCCDRPAGSDPVGQEASAVRRQAGTRMSHEGPFFDYGLQHQQPNHRGPQPVNNLIGN